MLTILAIILLVGSFALSVVLTAIVKNFAARTGFVAHPATDRYHQTAVPLGGGIAIFATLLILILPATAAIRLLPGYLDSFAQAANIDPSDFLGKIDQLITILLGAFILFVLGLWDDKSHHLCPFSSLDSPDHQCL